MIQFQNFNFYYHPKKDLLKNINLNLESGKVYGLFGKNGSGKTTFVKAMVGLVFPKEGQVQINKFVPKERTPEFLSSIYYLPEEFELPKLSIKHFVALFSSYYPNFLQDDFEDYLSRFEVSFDDEPHKLSFGQQKKMMISFALACNTKFLILDEPTNGLDVPSKNQFKKMIASAITDEKTIFITTHQAKDLENILDHLLVLDHTEFILNSSFHEISRKIKCTFSPNKPTKKCLGYSASAGGYLVLEENIEDADTLVQLELLINSVLDYPNDFKDLFSNPKLSLS
ncbi:ABC transporter ATP-binding protein [Wenyingzhuangia sp. IMCC45533]